MKFYFHSCCKSTCEWLLFISKRIISKWRYFMCRRDFLPWYFLPTSYCTTDKF